MDTSSDILLVNEEEQQKDEFIEPKFRFGISKRFALINRLITRDLNKNTRAPTFYKYTKDDIASYLKDPYKNKDKLRDAIVYIYGASPHFRRLIQYFAGLSDLAYVVSPYKIDPATQNKKTINKNYRRVLNIMSALDPKTQFPKIIRICLREDTCYCTMHVTADNITIQTLPPKYCDITSIEDGVPNVTFDFSYFDTYKDNLPFYPEEFKRKYALYQKNMTNYRWQELDSPTSFAVKLNTDILDYPLPPFAGVLREIYDLEDFKSMKLTKQAIENYAMIVMKLPMSDEGNWLLDEEKAKRFWSNLDSVLPEEVGSILSPMDMDKISFEKSNVGDIDTVAEAEQNLFTAAGVSSLLFNNEKASSGALTLSIKADQAITYGIVKSLENVVNRYIHTQGAGKLFKVTFLDVSPYNRKEMGDQYLKACQSGLPMVSMYAASQGLGQAEMECMNFLENDVLDLKSKLRPLALSSTMGANSEAATDAGGAPTKDLEDLSDSGEQSREDGDNWD